MTTLLPIPVAGAQAGCADGVPAAAHSQNAHAHFAQVLARKLTDEEDTPADAPEPLAFGLALILPQGELGAAVEGADSAGQGAAALADGAGESCVDARAALEVSDDRLAARSALAPVLEQRQLRVASQGDSAMTGSDTDAPVLDAVVEQNHGGAGDSVGQVLQHIQTARSMKAAARAQTPDSINATPEVSAKVAVNVSTDAAPSAGGAGDASAVPTAQAQDVLVSGSAPVLTGQSAPAPAAGAAMPVSLAMPVVLGHPQWAQALGQQVLHLARAGNGAPQVAHLRLDPPELGPLRIELQLHAQVVQASFVSAHAPVRLALESALAQLHEQLGQAGLSLGQTHVGDQGTPQDTPEHAAPPATLAPASAPAVQPSPAPARTPNTLIDTFA